MLKDPKLRRRLAGERGVVALEALLSIMLLGGFFIVMWSVSVAIYNQSKIQTATQFAAQGAAVIYDRETYRGQDVGGSFAAAQEKAKSVARNLFAENACGMMGTAGDNDLPIGCSGTAPTTDAQAGLDELRIECAPSIFAAYSAENCGGNQEDAINARVLRAVVSARADQALLLPSFTNESGQASIEIGGRAQSFAFYPETGS